MDSDDIHTVSKGNTVVCSAGCTWANRLTISANKRLLVWRVKQQKVTIFFSNKHIKTIGGESKILRLIKPHWDNILVNGNFNAIDLWNFYYISISHRERETNKHTITFSTILCSITTRYGVTSGLLSWTYCYSTTLSDLGFVLHNKRFYNGRACAAGHSELLLRCTVLIFGPDLDENHIRIL